MLEREPRRRGFCALLGAALGLSALGGAREARATLYQTEFGYQYTGGSAGYWGDEAWSYGSMRLEGGWYPYGRLSAYTDSYYDWVLAPGLGIEKGVPGLGKGRLGATWSHGDFRYSHASGDSGAFEAGWFRALDATWSGDLSYTVIVGDLFGGAERELVNLIPQRGLAPRHLTIQQAQFTLGADPKWGARRLHFYGSLAEAWTSDHRVISVQSLGLRVPVHGSFSAQTGLAFVQSAGGDQYYVSGGLVYGFSGRR